MNRALLVVRNRLLLWYLRRTGQRVFIWIGDTGYRVIW